MIKRTSRKAKKALRHKRVRKKVKGQENRPRLSVFKSSRNIYAQIIDDVNSTTLVSASTLTPKVRELTGGENKKKLDAAKIVGTYLGELALSKGIKKVSFDRGGYPFHGRVKSLADAAREAGLEF